MSNTAPRGSPAAAPAAEAAKLPDVILLNGTSSAGKSSLVLALQAQLPFVRMGIDDFIWERAPIGWYDAPEGFVFPPSAGAPPEFGAEALKLWRAYHRAVRACVDEGLRVVVDDLIMTRAFLDDWVTALSGVEVFFVGVHCAPEELTLREIARRDRRQGSAVGALAYAHAHTIYDLEVDSTSTPSSALAAQVIAAARARTGPSAFERLRVSASVPTGGSDARRV